MNRDSGLHEHRGCPFAQTLGQYLQATVRFGAAGSVASPFSSLVSA
jgi:hypothetical protein